MKNRRSLIFQKVLLFCALFFLLSPFAAQAESTRDGGKIAVADAAPARGAQARENRAKVQAGQRKGQAGQRKGQAGTRKAEAPKLSVAQKMLASCGRDPRAAQPEKDFFLEVPDYAYDGTAIVLRFGARGAQSVILELGGKKLRVAGPSGPQSGSFEALLPVALGAAAPSLPLSLKIVWEGGKEEVMSAPLPLKKRSYPVQKLTVDGKFVSPPPEVAEKIKKDRAEIRAAVSRTSRTRHWRLPMARPVPGEVTSLYGSRRVFNGVPKNPHKGTDFDAEDGEPVRAIATGEVVLVSEHYYGGNTILVDHGLGVVSAYLHLSAFKVRPGQKVERGEVIGMVGSTGRVTGPHLHLSLYVLGENVDAETCLEPAS
ncbi:MAG: M23 family metallopeptidase [Desulfovibrio sp.]|nr:M23 family metallopeptidase [Desulfovibrio sp.]